MRYCVSTSDPAESQHNTAPLCSSPSDCEHVTVCGASRWWIDVPWRTVCALLWRAHVCECALTDEVLIRALQLPCIDNGTCDVPPDGSSVDISATVRLKSSKACKGSKVWLSAEKVTFWVPHVQSSNHNSTDCDSRAVVHVWVTSGWASHTELEQQRQQLSLNHCEA